MEPRRTYAPVAVVRKSEPQLTTQSGRLRKAPEGRHFTRPWAIGKSPVAHTTLSETGRPYGAASGRRRRSKWAGILSISDALPSWIANLQGRSAVVSGIGCGASSGDTTTRFLTNKTAASPHRCLRRDQLSVELDVALRHSNRKLAS